VKISLSAEINFELLKEIADNVKISIGKSDDKTPK
jgi:hypothetical protein